MALIYVPLSAGFLISLTLIIAIGAQNAFILRMGLLRSHIWVLCLICAISDALLIGLGVSGMGAFVDSHPDLLFWVTLGGAIFLLFYAGLAMRRVFNPNAMPDIDNFIMPLMRAVATCLAFTFLNPHVYLDTMVLVGSLASHYPPEQRFWFGLGASLGSFVWFFSLGFGARLLAPWFRNPRSWQVLDLLIAMVMATIAISLLAQIMG